MALADTRNDIIDGALEAIGVKAADEDSNDADVATAAKWLDRMVKRLQSTGAHLWTRNSATLFISAGVFEYQIGGTADATETYSESTTNVAAVALDKKIFVTSSSGVLEGDQFGVRLDDGTINFSAVTQVAATFVVVTTGLVSAAASGNVCYFYTTRLEKALRIPDARRKLSGQEISMIEMGRIDYLNLPNKDNQGTPVQYYYDPKQDTGDMFLWPSPAADETLITFSYYKPLDVFSDADDAAEFPDEWIEALIMGLADRLFPIFAQPKPPGFREDAYQAITDALDWDQGDASIYLAPSKTRG
tara:strand:- start:1470 stop:2378 length:909 start_codon:yes stop_codon:yes gene_type:complete